MGRSVDWLDVARDHGPQAVADALRAALDGPAAQPPAPPTTHPAPPLPPPTHGDDGHEGETPPGRAVPQGGVGQDPDDPHFEPPEELILPSQAGPRARIILARIFNPERGDSAWQLRRFGGSWYVYVPGTLGVSRWRLHDEEGLRAAVRELLEGYWTRRWVEKGGGGWKFQRFAPTDRVVDDILKAIVHVVGVGAESVPAWLPQDFDPDGVEVDDRARWRRDHVDQGPVEPAKVIAFRNGLLDVESWVRGEVRMLPHNSRWFSMSTLDTELPLDVMRLALREEDEGREFDERLEEMCPTWLGFVREMSRESEAWLEALQRFVGYAMTPDVSLDKMLWVQGLPGTGKTTLVEGIEAAIGHENVAYTDLDALAGRFGVAPLVGKNVAIISEMHVGRMTDAAAALQRLKAISGGSPQQVEDKFLRSRARVRMTVKFIITPNEEPRLPDASAAIMRRLVVLPVSQVVTRPDPGLSERLQAERAGIRVWALLGLRRLWLDVEAGRPGFDQPEEGRELLLEIEAASSPMRAWVREQCVVGPGNSVLADCLWKLWKTYSEAENLSDKMTRQTFGRQLRAAVPSLHKVDRVVDGERVKVYVGVRPRLDEDGDGPLAMINHVRFSSAYLAGEDALTHDTPRTPPV